MSTTPTIVSIAPRGPITRPETGIPVLATLHPIEGDEFDVPATATAWTRDAVQVTWNAPAIGLTSDWIPAIDVRRGKAAQERLKTIPGPRTD